VVGCARRDLADSGMTTVASVEKIIWGTEHASAAAVSVVASVVFGASKGVGGAARLPDDTGRSRVQQETSGGECVVQRSAEELQEFCSPAGCGSSSCGRAEVQA
jgi:hypothetical protein